MTLLSQLASPPAGAIESWLLSAAAIGSIALLAKKLFLTKSSGDGGYVTKTEFHHELTIVRDKIDARFLGVVEKLETVKGELLAAGENRSNSLQGRLNQVESTVARLDERTKK
jgi:hypothetical protein